jgi:putative phosphoribosyl transferase
LVVRKLGIPGVEETAMGAIASGGFQYLNQALVQALNIPSEVMDGVGRREQWEMIRQEKAYRDDLPPLDLRDYTVILVDDGLATGATIQVAISAIQQQQPKALTVAVPVAEPDICEWVGKKVDCMFWAETPRPFYAVSFWCKEFSQTTDDEVAALLRQVRNQVSEVAGRR